MAKKTKKKPGKPTPGSDLAIKQGCVCPVLDNEHGKGYMGMSGIFVQRAGCPVHKAPAKKGD